MDHLTKALLGCGETEASGRKARAIASEKVTVFRGRHMSIPGLSRKEGMVDQRDERGTEGALGGQEAPEGVAKLRGRGNGMCPGFGKAGVGCGSDGNVSQSPEDPQTLVGVWTALRRE